jgi:hypothetical protein
MLSAKFQYWSSLWKATEQLDSLQNGTERDVKTFLAVICELLRGR